MAGRPRNFDETEILDKAIDVFWENGYEGSSAEELLKAMGIGKGSFYLIFKGGKEELYEKCLERFSVRALDNFCLSLEKSESPVEFLKNFFIGLSSAGKDKKLKGCYLGNALSEMSVRNPRLRKKAALLLSKLEFKFVEIVSAAKISGSLKTSLSPEIIARHLINLWNGLNITIRQYPSDPGIKDLIILNLKLLE
jgi:TetR/AcrR family transcriptional regulator, transcriptional repressor for nem operon